MTRFPVGDSERPTAVTFLDAPVIRIRSSRRHVVPSVGDTCRTVGAPQNRRLAWEDVHRVN